MPVIKPEGLELASDPSSLGRSHCRHVGVGGRCFAGFLRSPPCLQECSSLRCLRAAESVLLQRRRNLRRVGGHPLHGLLTCVPARALGRTRRAPSSWAEREPVHGVSVQAVKRLRRVASLQRCLSECFPPLRSLLVCLRDNCCGVLSPTETPGLSGEGEVMMMKLVLLLGVKKERTWGSERGSLINIVLSHWSLLVCASLTP